MQTWMHILKSSSNFKSGWENAPEHKKAQKKETRFDRVSFFCAFLLQTNRAVGISHIADGATLRALFVCSKPFSLPLKTGCERMQNAKCKKLWKGNLRVSFFCKADTKPPRHALLATPPLPKGGKKSKGFQGGFPGGGTIADGGRI